MNATSQSKALLHALEQCKESYEEQHPQSEKLFGQACRFMPGGNTRSVLYTDPFPLCFESAESTYLKTVDGQTYVDFLGEYTAGIYGHKHPIIRQALEGALSQGWNYGGQGKTENQLAEIVCKRFPAMELVRFVNSGTEAVMMALATAVAFTGKRKVLIFAKGYHGSTISARTPSSKISINLPHEFIVGTYNDVRATDELVSSLPNDTLAAILVEPMLGSGGSYQGTPEFLNALRRITTEHKALLIFDEVMTSRLSYHGLGHTTGIVPDLMTLGKWIGGGMSFGAFGGRKDIMEWYDPRSGKLDHPGTFNNNIFTMRAGVAGCNFLDAERIDRLNRLGDKLRDEVNLVLEAHEITGKIPVAPVPEQVRDAAPDGPPTMFMKGVGSLLNMHFVGEHQHLLRALFWHHMLKSGIYMAQRGFISLNTELTEDHVAMFVRAVDSFCTAWVEYLR